MAEGADLTYTPRGATTPQTPNWTESPPGFRRFGTTVPIGRGEDTRNTAGKAVLRGEDDGRVPLTLRSLTRAAPAGPRRPLFPVLLPARLHVRSRCLPALRDPGVRSTAPRSLSRTPPAPPAF